MNRTQSPYDKTEGSIARAVKDRQNLLRKEMEDRLREEILDYDSRRERFWQRDYSSLSAYAESVDDNRRRWADAVGVFEPKTRGHDAHLDLWCDDEVMTAWWVTINLTGNLRGRAILALPKSRVGPVPLVIAQHGIGSSPERVFGLDDPTDIYKAYGRHLVEQGFAVVAPMNITEAAPRARMERLCKLLGKTLWGLEILRTKRLLDYLESRDEIDISRVGMYGISLGGAYTMFTTPLEPRIGPVVVCAWYNDRRRKMVVDDPRYSCFLSVDEEHIWIPGWLREFSDSDLGSLICPRPMLIEQGKADGIGWWPFMLREFEELKGHYDRLGMGERVALDLHEGGHEIDLEKSIPFLKKWLQI